MPAADGRRGMLERQASEKPQGRKPRAGLCTTVPWAMAIWERQVMWRGSGVVIVGPGVQRDIPVSEHARTIVGVRLKRTNA